MDAGPIPQNILIKGRNASEQQRHVFYLLQLAGALLFTHPKILLMLEVVHNTKDTSIYSKCSSPQILAGYSDVGPLSYVVTKGPICAGDPNVRAIFMLFVG